MNESVIKNDWFADIMAASSLTVDKRFNHWARYIDICNMDTDGLKMYEGDWIGPGTVQVETGRHRIILACAVSGTNKYHYKHFRLLVMKPDTVLELSDLFATDRDEDWLLRLKLAVCKLLETLKQRDQGILTPRDNIRLASDNFESIVSQLPEDEQLECYVRLFMGKEKEFLEKLQDELSFVIKEGV